MRTTIGIIIVFTGLFLSTYAHATSNRTFFENTYSYETRNACRSIARKYGYSAAIDCAQDYDQERRKLERDKSLNELIKSETELNKTLERRYRRW